MMDPGHENLYMKRNGDGEKWLLNYFFVKDKTLYYCRESRKVCLIFS